LVDDHSSDETVRVANNLGIKHIIVHEKNSGYGANQKTCYKAALGLGADIVVMLHPDYQYAPQLIPAMVSIIGNGLYPVVLGPASWETARWPAECPNTNISPIGCSRSYRTCC
jgi:glycosyltransferase involved in cell wall biosynthesis